MHLFTIVYSLQASGVSVHPECVELFNDIKLKHNHRYIVYALTDDLRQIRVLKTAPVCELHLYFDMIVMFMVLVHSGFIR